MHAISAARSDERQRYEQLQHELELLRLERDRLKTELDQALERIAALSPPQPQPPVAETVAETVLSVPPEPSEQSLSRIVVSTFPAAEPDAAERRHLERVGHEFEVEFLDDSHLMSGLTQDISQGGLFVATYQTLPIGSTISLALELPGGRVEVQGEVRWARAECESLAQRPGFGVAFTELSAEAVAALTELCRTHPPHYYDSDECSRS